MAWGTGWGGGGRWQGTSLQMLAAAQKQPHVVASHEGTSLSMRGSTKVLHNAGKDDTMTWYKVECRGFGGKKTRGLVEISLRVSEVIQTGLVPC